MKRNKLVYVFCLMFALISCSKNSNEQVNINFGETKYNEPFVGIFKSRPSWLESTLDWPVIKWFKPDTAIISRTIEIEFNEDAVRSKSLATINMVDTNFNDVSKVQWYCNGKAIEGGKFAVKASSEPQQINIAAKIHPSIGEKKCYGYMTIASEDLDEVNTIKLMSEGTNSIAVWNFYHKIGWPIMIWLIWILIPILLIWLLWYIIKALIFVTKSKASMIVMHPTNKKMRKKKANEPKKEKKRCPCCMQMKICSPVFGCSSSSSIAEKCQTLLKIADQWEYLTIQEKEDIYNVLCPKMKSLLNAYWDEIKKPTPTSNGRWIGRKGNGSFYFDDEFVPSEKNNRNGMMWKELVAAYRTDFNLRVDGGIKYQNNRIDLKPYSVATIKVKYEYSNLDKLRDRGGSADTIQEIAAPYFTKKLYKDIEKGGYGSFWNYKDGIKDGVIVRNTPLVIHEDYDGETLMLVPKYLHDNWAHYGGIALVSKVIQY